MKWRSGAPGFFGEDVTSEEIEAADLFFDDLMGHSARPPSGGRWGRGVGPSSPLEATETDGASEVVPRLPAGFRLGTWLDVGGRNLTAHGSVHAALLHELGMTDACIMVNGVDDAAFGFGSVAQTTIQSFANLLRGSNIRLTLTSWIRPERTYIDALVADLPAFASSVGARGIELDAEEPWTRRSPVGFASHDEAAEYLFTALQPARAMGLELVVTPQVDVTPSARMRPLVRRADLVVPQAYSVYRSGSASHAIGGVYGPRGIQDRAVAKVAEARQASGTPMIMGLAAYSRSSWPRNTGRQIMELELSHTVSLANAGVQGVRYWSWKHIAGFDGVGGSPANTYARDFFRAVAGLGP